MDEKIFDAINAKKFSIKQVSSPLVISNAFEAPKQNLKTVKTNIFTVLPVIMQVSWVLYLCRSCCGLALQTACSSIIFSNEEELGALRNEYE